MTFLPPYPSNPTQLIETNHHEYHPTCSDPGHRHSIHCILPPHVLDHMMESPDPKVRRIAMENIITSTELRTLRSAVPAERSLILGINSAGVKNREVYDAGGKPAAFLPGKLVRSEGGKKTGNPAADEAYDFAGDTYDFYDTVFGRKSLDNQGLKLVSSVHLGKKFNNAFWNGRQMAYGDGDGVAFGRFTQSLDVVAHELSHGVVTYSADLVYQDEPGAMNEHMADVFGSLIKQWKLKLTADKADWLIGRELISPAPTRRALRDMANPGTAYTNDPLLGSDPQPGHIKNKYTGGSDNGGVHVNSGIPNLAFVLAARAIGGNAWDVAGSIWYEVLTRRLVRTSVFADLAKETIDVSAKHGAAAKKAVKEAWKKVGL